MKKFYMLLVVCFCFATNGYSQNYYWIGPANGNWNNNLNWSNTSGGAAAAAFPQLVSDNVIFNANATVSLNVSIDLNILSVTGSNTSVIITGTGGSGNIRTITGHSTSAVSPALSIASGCVLEHSATDNTTFTFVFGEDAQGQINGDWYFTGDINNDGLASFFLGSDGFDTRLNVNNGGSVTIGTTAYIEANEDTGDEYMVFNSGSSLNLKPNGPIVPKADYHANSTINITGVIDASVSFEETSAVGNITYNCTAQANGAFPLYLSLIDLDILGDLNVLSTNDNEMTLLSWLNTMGLPAIEATIMGDLTIQGDSKVSVARNDGPEIPNNLFVEGNLVVNGTSFSIHTGDFISSDPTVLHIKGNITHTAGVFTALSTVTNETTDLFVIEMNGTTLQTISSHNADFDNTDNQITLKINNASGVSLLSSLSVGRLNFNTANKGILTTNSNIIIVNNTTPVSVSNLVINMPSDPALGFVNGTIRRKTANAEPVLMPVGSGSIYRGLSILPNSVMLTTFESKFTNSNHGGPVQSPLKGVSGYYWDVNRIGAGSNAAVQLTVPAPVTGAEVTDALIVAKFNGTNWIMAKGTTGTFIIPGTAGTGTVTSEVQTSFSPFTIGYTLQSTLPTILVSFTARKTGKETGELKWKITENSTPFKFEVLRSADGINFLLTGTVSGTEHQLSYDFTDNHLLAGNNYYRLKMYDKDGSVTYSTIVVISNGSEGIQLHSMVPTMVYDRARLNINSSIKGNMQLVITDINGRVMQNQSASITTGSQEIWINASRLSKGMYQITGYVRGEKIATIRFIKL